MAIDTPVVEGSVTIRGKTFSIFGTRARAEEYLTASLDGSTFFDADFSDRLRALVMARRWLDRQSWKDGFPIPADNLVPLDIEFAQYELTLVLLEDPDAFNSRSTGSNEKRLQAGPVSIDFFSRTDGGGSSFQGEGVFPSQALDLLKPYLGSKISVVTPVVGGTGNKSNVLPVDAFDLTDPL